MTNVQGTFSNAAVRRVNNIDNARKPLGDNEQCYCMSLWWYATPIRQCP